MIPLGIHGRAAGPLHQAVLGRVSRTPVPIDSRADYVLAASSLDSADLAGYAGAITLGGLTGSGEPPAPVIHNRMAMSWVSTQLATSARCTG
jgi:hypothetical protein